MRLSVSAAIAVVCSALGGCAYNDHFDNRVARYDVAAEQSRDTMILANIIRASHGEPLSFFQLGKISGYNNAQATTGLPSLVFGPHVSHAVNAATAALQSETIFGASPGGGTGFTGNSANISGSTTFEVNPQETKEFYRGLLSEVEPRTLELFIHQGLSRELLGYLFTERLIVQRDHEAPFELRNDPLRRDTYPMFQKYVTGAMTYGLRSELLPSAAKKGGKGKAGEAGGDKAAASEAKAPEHYRLCFDPLLRDPHVQWAGNSPICGQSVEKSLASEDRTVVFNEGHSRVKLTVLPRSAYGIFQFLGRILAAEDAEVRLQTPEAMDSGALHDESLFTLTRGTNAEGGCYLTAEDGPTTWCVPRVGATNTKRIISLLAQLIALNTSIADVPITPTVRVIQ